MATLVLNLSIEFFFETVFDSVLVTLLISHEWDDYIFDLVLDECQQLLLKFRNLATL